MISAEELKDKKIYHHTTDQDKVKLTNACYLMAAFMIVVLDRSAEDAYNTFETFHEEILPYRDASSNVEVTYKCQLYHCLKGLEFALKLKWYDFKSFNLEEYVDLPQFTFADTSTTTN